MPVATDPLPRTADVVVIGGGVMGTSVAWHLAAAGSRDVLLLEEKALASGSSGKPLGGVRAQFSTAANVALGARSLDAFRRFPDEIGTDIGLREVGYLFLLRGDREVEGFRSAIAMQNALGVPSSLISAEDAVALCPYVDPGGVTAAAWSPRDGFARPAAVVSGYAQAARRLGARISTGVTVTGIDVAAGRVIAVGTTAGRVATPAVVCAAGAWSERVGAMAGVSLPVRPLRRQIAFTDPMPVPPSLPFTIDYASTFYLHPGGDGLLVGMADPGTPEGFDTTYDPSWEPVLRAAMSRCVPSLAGVPLGRGWAGLYEMTPDCDALIGEAPGVDRFLYATGFSGHGFLMAPAVGEAVAALYSGMVPPCDVAPFDARRFAERRDRAEMAIV